MNFDPSLIHINSHNAPTNIKIDKPTTGVPVVISFFACGLSLSSSGTTFAKDKIQTYPANQNENASI